MSEANGEGPREGKQVGRFTIEKNVRLVVGDSRRGEMRELALEMEFGDSVFVPTEKDKQTLSSAINNSGFAVRSAKEGAGFRVWKLQKQKPYETRGA